MSEYTDLVAELIDAGLLEAAVVVDGDVRVADVSRRNRNLAVHASAGGSFVVKSGDTVAHEAELYRLAGDELCALGCVPRAVVLDSGRLALELLDGHENVREHHARRGRLPVRIAEAMGRGLATLHAVEVPPGLPSHPPDILGITCPALGMVRNASAGNADLFRLVQRFGELAAGLDTIAADWQPRALIHGDPRWDNWLVPVEAGPARPRAVLVDWEFASLGDPSWDVGCVLAEYLGHWVLAIPPLPGVRLRDAAAHTRVPLSDVQPASRGFWRAYAAAGADVALTDVMSCAAAKLVQLAAEQAHHATEVTASTAALLQLAANVFADPYAAAGQLLGLQRPLEAA